MLPQQTIEKIFQLWDELSDHASSDSDVALNHCMRSLSGLVGARNAFWVGAVRLVKDNEQEPDLLHGWRIRGIRMMDQAYQDTIRMRAAMQVKMIPDPGATNIALVAGTGKFRAYRLHAGTLVADLAAFKQTDHYDFYYAKPGISDRLWVAFPVSSEAESFIVFDRYGADGHFNDSDLEVVAFALRGIKWFHRQLLLSHGLGICVESLTPAERKVKQGLLSGATEKEIGQQLSLTPGSVHQYAMRIYRKFGVKGRTEFMALWLAGGF
ncbi:MAG TPA: LuxR C-terminal-related transcriptional regulator [Gammaproteobacteria bacterium]